ncbi:MAG: NBR1-Ig-like domain-containing protein [Chloroflexi bacterium]|nr:NBR1-Ig-like domain-containing protein [Chloroflexota bacterium]
MKKVRTPKLWIMVLIIGLMLSSCSILNTISEGKTNQVEETVSARLTQISIETLIAQVTLQAMASPTPQPTNTLPPLPTSTSTSTPLPPTATALPPTATAVPPTATVIPIPCNLASFIGDISIPDGTSLYAGQPFIKTWRVINIGSCSWTTAYTLFFVSGNAMSAPASITFPNTVKPGEAVDLSVSMIAPGSVGDYTGIWMISPPGGPSFGVGNSRNVPMTVRIIVSSIPTQKDTSTVYDFVSKYCSAQWRTNAAFISCPTGSYDFKNGTVSRSFAPVIENGLTDDEGAIITIPAIGGDGFIQGQFPKMIIHSGDRFRSTLLCTYSMTKCSVTFELLYQEYGTSSMTSLGTWEKVYDNSTVSADVDLSALDGKDIIFFLKVSSQSNPTDDFAQWMAARITHP